MLWERRIDAQVVKDQHAGSPGLPLSMRYELEKNAKPCECKEELVLVPAELSG